MDERHEQKFMGLVHLQFDEYAPHLTILMFLLSMILIRMVFRRIPYVSIYVPESLVLLIFGVMLGAVIRTSHFQSDIVEWKLTPTVFFTYLLPPIVLNSAYSMYNRVILDYMGNIMIFAVLGTLANFVLIALILYGVYTIGAFGPLHVTMQIKCFFLFSSLLTAVDPVAVLSIFDDIGVDLNLHYTVLGESLINDAVTVVLYDVMSQFYGTVKVTAQKIMTACFSFFTVSIGGLLIGLLVGVITCLITRFRDPLGGVVLLVLAFLSYILGDCLGWSGIVSMIMCGIVQAAYAFHNISHTSAVMVRKITSVTADLCESIIFLFIGLEVLNRNFVWHTGISFWTLAACLVARSVTVFVLAAIINRMNKKNSQIKITEQIILIYGGLRGAVCLCLAILIKPSYFENDGKWQKELFTTVTLFIIFVTVGIMGTTIKPLVYWLKIPMRKENQLSLFHQLNEHVVNETMTAIEAIVGKMGYNALRDILQHVDDKYIRKVLQHDPQTHDKKIVQLYERIALRLHYAMIQPAKSGLYLTRLPLSLKQRYNERLASSGSDVNLFTSLPPQLIVDHSDDESLTGAALTHLIVENDQQSKHAQKTTASSTSFRKKIAEFTKHQRSDERSATDSMSILSSDSKDIRDLSTYLRSSRQYTLDFEGSDSVDYGENMMSLFASKSRMLQKSVLHSRSKAHKNLSEGIDMAILSAYPVAGEQQNIPLYQMQSCCACCRRYSKERRTKRSKHSYREEKKGAPSSASVKSVPETIQLPSHTIPKNDRKDNATQNILLAPTGKDSINDSVKILHSAFSNV